MQDLNLKNIKSSYSNNGYGEVFYYLTKSFKPKKIVELGSYQGYSALYIVSALSEQNYISDFFSIDLHDNYLFKHSTKNILINNFIKNKLSNIKNVNLNFIQYDALKYYNNFQDNSIDLLHIDIDNDGNMLEKCFEKYHKKLKLFSIVIFEGGSEERDCVNWMLSRKKVTIKNFIDSIFFKQYYDYIILKPFPSITIAMKKQN